MVICYIGVGSNLGDRHHNIDTAIKKIKMMPETKVVKVSEVIQTKPIGGPPQGLYLNTVLEIQTGLFPYQLLIQLQKIESTLGRIRLMPNGPRTIDLDILTYGDTIMNESALDIPHPRILERKFVLSPLRKIAPQVIAKIKKLLDKKRARVKVKSKKAGLKKAIKKDKQNPKKKRCR